MIPPVNIGAAIAASRVSAQLVCHGTHRLAVTGTVIVMLLEWHRCVIALKHLITSSG